MTEGTDTKMSKRGGTEGAVLILSQVYVPDPASVGQHMSQAAAELVQRGRRVVVLTSARGYNDPTIKYPARETIDGVDVIRLPLSSFGKANLVIRALAAGLFMVQAMFRGLFVKKLDKIIVSTSPPMCIIAALFITALRRKVKVCFWVMDINPEQLISIGKVKEGSITARFLNGLNRAMLKKADSVVVLDRYMAETMRQKYDPGAKMLTMPPWPPEDFGETVEHAENRFRQTHGLDGKFVVMYSGNHGIFLPLDAVLGAAVRMKDDPDVVFMFIGDGARKKEVEAAIKEHSLKNTRSLPYQPLSELRYSLSAADLHVVTIADDMVGVIHPCKVYGAMAVARPLLLVGPDPCHVSDLINEHKLGWHVRNGDIDGVERAIREAMSMNGDDRRSMGDRARRLIETTLSKSELCSRFADAVESAA